MGYEIVDAKFVEDNMKDMPLVDVRPKSMFDDGHIPGALNIPFDEAKMATVGADGPDESPELAAKFAEEFAAAGIGKDDDVIIYCLTGYHATKTSDMLSKEGYSKIHDYKGAFNDWSSDPTRPVSK